MNKYFFALLVLSFGGYFWISNGPKIESDIDDSDQIVVIKKDFSLDPLSDDHQSEPSLRQNLHQSSDLVQEYVGLQEEVTPAAVLNDEAFDGVKVEKSVDQGVVYRSRGNEVVTGQSDAVETKPAANEIVEGSVIAPVVAQEIKSIQPMDMQIVSLVMPDNQQLIVRLKKAGLGGLAANKHFISKLAGQTLSAEQIYEIASEELDKFKDKWVAKQRRGKLCNVLFKDYPDHVAYLKQCENIEDNPKLYWKAAKLYAQKLKTDLH